MRCFRDTIKRGGCARVTTGGRCDDNAQKKDSGVTNRFEAVRGRSMNGEALRSTLEHCRDTLDEAVQYASQSYQFGPNAYAYEALMRCTTARDTVARLTATITDISHYVDALEQRGAA